MRWIRISIINFTLLAFLGCILRYKIAFSLPFIDQKHLLHAHSHFAFAGWVSQILMCLLLYAIDKGTLAWNIKIKKFEKLLLLNLFTAYGMLISFTIQGYAFYSIVFSTASIFISYWFAYSVYPLIKESKIHPITQKYFLTALFFNIISSIGPFLLAFMMVKHSLNQDYLLAAVFYYLHFQYNGWFLFIIFGTMNQQIADKGIAFDFKRKFNILLAAACITLLLSDPWVNKQNMLGIVLFVIVILQFNVFISFLRNMNGGDVAKLKLGNKIKVSLKNVVSFALIIKGLLQILILVPSLDQYAFGLRPIIIAYLHLVLIGIVSFYIFFYMVKEKLLIINKQINYGLLIFLSGFVLNEIILVLQGLSLLNIIGLPLTNESLFLAAIIMFTGLFVVTTGLFKNTENIDVELKEMPLYSKS